MTNTEPKVMLSCWTCSKEYDASRWSNRYGVRCDDPGCDGYVISPSGKIRLRLEGDFSSPAESFLYVISKEPTL